MSLELDVLWRRADAGDLDAWNELGRMYGNKEGTTYDPERAAECYRMLAQLWRERAQTEVLPKAAEGLTPLRANPSPSALARSPGNSSSRFGKRMVFGLIIGMGLLAALIAVMFPYVRSLQEPQGDQAWLPAWLHLIDANVVTSATTTATSERRAGTNTATSGHMSGTNTANVATGQITKPKNKPSPNPLDPVQSPNNYPVFPLPQIDTPPSPNPQPAGPPPVTVPLYASTNDVCAQILKDMEKLGREGDAIIMSIGPSPDPSNFSDAELAEYQAKCDIANKKIQQLQVRVQELIKQLQESGCANANTPQSNPYASMQGQATDPSLGYKRTGSSDSGRVINTTPLEEKSPWSGRFGY